MSALLLALVEICGPNLDGIERSVLANTERVGEICIQGIDGTGDEDVLETVRVFLPNGQPVRQWRLLAVEMTLMLQHAHKFHLLRGQRPRARLLEPGQPFRTLIIDFPERFKRVRNPAT
jgi:hypothetical protein